MSEFKFLQKYIILFLILIIGLLYFKPHTTTSIPSSDKNTVEFSPSCDADNIEETVKKLALNTADSLLRNIDMRSSERQSVNSSFYNVKYVTLSSVYPIHTNRERNIIECVGDVDIYTNVIRNIPTSIKYRVIYNEMGSAYVEIIDLKFRYSHFLYDTH